MKLVFLLEERSMKVFLESFLPRVLRLLDLENQRSPSFTALVRALRGMAPP